MLDSFSVNDRRNVYSVSKPELVDAVVASGWSAAIAASLLKKPLFL